MGCSCGQHHTTGAPPIRTQEPHFRPPLPFTCLRGVRPSAPGSSLHPQGGPPGLPLTGQVWEHAVAAVPSRTPRRSLPGMETWGPNTCPGRTPHLCACCSCPHKMPLSPSDSHDRFNHWCHSPGTFHTQRLVILEAAGLLTPSSQMGTLRLRGGGVAGTGSAVQKGAVLRRGLGSGRRPTGNPMQTRMQSSASSSELSGVSLLPRPMASPVPPLSAHHRAPAPPGPGGRIAVGNFPASGA